MMRWGPSCPEMGLGSEEKKFMRRMINRLERKKFAEGKSVPVEASNIHAHESPRSSARLLELQRTHGNHFVQRLLNPQHAASSSTDTLQRRSDAPSSSLEAPPQVYQALRSPGLPLDPSSRDFFASSFAGHDFTDVRVHTDAEAAQSAASVDALAYTVGTDVFFAAGQYTPETSAGQQLLAHELTHVVQQGEGRGGGISEKLEVGEAGDEYEQEADRVAAQVMRRERISGPAEVGGDVVQRQLGSKGGVVQREVKGEATEKKEEAKKEEKAAEPAWDYDPDKLLDQAGVNPEFKKAAQAGLAAAVAAGLRPKVHEAFRSIERSDELYEAFKKGGPRAAPGWGSLHNYGLAMDVYLVDEKNNYIDNNSSPKTWYKLFKQLNTHLKAQNFVWGEPINDADHWEYHPSWTGLAGGATLDKARKEAMEAAEAVDKAAAATAAAATATPSAAATPTAGAAATPAPPATAITAAASTTKTDWMQYFWYAAGAGGTAPPPKVEAPKPAADESKSKAKK
jgi:hypothetical protein